MIVLDAFANTLGDLLLYSQDLVPLRSSIAAVWVAKVRQLSSLSRS